MYKVKLTRPNDEGESTFNCQFAVVVDGMIVMDARQRITMNHGDVVEITLKEREDENQAS